MWVAMSSLHGVWMLSLFWQRGPRRRVTWGGEAWGRVWLEEKIDLAMREKRRGC